MPPYCKKAITKQMDKVSYALIWASGTTLNSGIKDLQTEDFLQGLKDALSESNRPSATTRQKSIINAYFEQLQKDQCRSIAKQWRVSAHQPWQDRRCGASQRIAVWGAEDRQWRKAEAHRHRQNAIIMARWSTERCSIVPYSADSPQSFVNQVILDGRKPW